MAVSPELNSLLRDLRDSRGESLRSAARALGVDPSHLSRIERGEKYPSRDLQERVARHYDVNPDDLAIAHGRVPADILAILQKHPDIMRDLRRRYGDAS
jgi:transcriptional regulator with XRE-family HTH domain